MSPRNNKEHCWEGPTFRLPYGPNQPTDEWMDWFGDVCSFIRADERLSVLGAESIGAPYSLSWAKKEWVREQDALLAKWGKNVPAE